MAYPDCIQLGRELPLLLKDRGHRRVPGLDHQA